MKFIRINLAIVFLFVLIAGCKKPNSYPDVPAITFKSMTIQRDNTGLDVSAHLVISFTDGDGDLGNDSPTPSDHAGFVVKMDTVHNGVWGRIEDPLDTLFSGTMPDLTPSGNNKALKGDIATDIVLLYGYPNDTIRYEVYIIDRAQHHSNTIVTPEVIIHTE